MPYKLQILDERGCEVVITDEVTPRNVLLFVIRDSFNVANRTHTLENMHCVSGGLFEARYVFPLLLGERLITQTETGTFDFNQGYRAFSRFLGFNPTHLDARGFFQTCLSDAGKAIYAELERAPLLNTPEKITLFFKMLCELHIADVAEIRISEGSMVVATSRRVSHSTGAATAAPPSVTETPELRLRRYCAESNNAQDPHFLRLLEAVKASGTVDQVGGGSGKSALHRALEAGHFAMAAALVAAGAQADIADSSGKFPCCYASGWTDKLGVAAAAADFESSGGGGMGGAGVREEADAASAKLFRLCESAVSVADFQEAAQDAKNYGVLERANAGGKTAVQTVLEAGDFAKAETLIKAGANFADVACCINHWVGQFPETAAVAEGGPMSADLGAYALRGWGGTRGDVVQDNSL